MTPVWVILVAFVMFGSAAFLGVRSGKWMADRIEPFDDGPPPGTPRPPLLIGGSALVGGLMARAGREPGLMLGQLPVHGVELLQLLAFGLLTFAMIACWYTDIKTGIVPDVFTLGALGATVLVLIATRDVPHLVTMLFVTAPFLLAALLSRGRGMGWGDVKIVALVGATVGFASLLAVAGACLVAVGVAFARRRRAEPIAFAPYLIGSIGFCIALPEWIPQGFGF